MDRPFVYINMAMTADGKITSSGREYPRFTSKRDRLTMDRLRAEADAILVGAGTLRADDPALHVRDEAMQAYRLSLGKKTGLTRVLVSASLNLDGIRRFFEEAHGGRRIVATVEDASEERVASIDPRAEVWKIGRGRVDLRGLLHRLAREGVGRLLVEGGGELNWALVRDDMVDELYVTIAPALLGGRDAPTLLEGEGLPMSDQRRLRLVEVDKVDDELFCRYAVIR